MNIKSTLLAGLVILGLLSSSHSLLAADNAESKSQENNKLSPRPIEGLWVWRMDTIATNEAQDRLFAFCRDHGFNRLLVQIHLDASRNLRQPEQWKRLLKEAHRQGIVIEALDGASDMARKENWDKTLSTLDIILAFNHQQPEGERFAGIHYDIEPYTAPAWKKGDQTLRQQIMLEYLQFLAKAKQKLHDAAPKMTLSVDIPMWYDRNPAAYDITYDGQHKNFHKHIQDLTDYIGIMSYRRQADGKNGVIASISDELAYAEQIGKVVCAALETIRLKEDAQISFYGLPPQRFWETKQAVEKELADRPGFGGMLIHSYDGLRALVETGQQ